MSISIFNELEAINEQYYKNIIFAPCFSEKLNLKDEKRVTHLFPFNKSSTTIKCETFLENRENGNESRDLFAVYKQKFNYIRLYYV